MLMAVVVKVCKILETAVMKMCEKIVKALIVNEISEQEMPHLPPPLSQSSFPMICSLKTLGVLTCGNWLYMILNVYTKRVSFDVASPF